MPLSHPLAQHCGKGYGKVYEHRLALFNKIGPGEHQCHWCSKLIYWRKDCRADAIVVDHLDENKWNNKPDNLVPSCRRCNAQRSIRADFLTHCPKGHEYLVVGVYIRKDGDGRQCMECNREQARAAYARRCGR